MSMDRTLRLLPFLLGACTSSCEDDFSCGNVLLQQGFHRTLVANENSRGGRVFNSSRSQSLYVDQLQRQKGFKRKALQPALLNLLEMPEKMFFFTHHKSGTRLARQLATELAEVLGEEHTKYEWPDLEVSRSGRIPGCAPTSVATYQNIDLDQLKNIKNECMDFRAIHFIRESAAITVSAYLYHSDSQTGGDHVWNADDSYDILSQLNVTQGLLQEAKVQAEYTLKDMADVYAELADANHSLIVGLEEFSEDYDGVTRKIFSFLLGSGHAKIDSLVEKAIEFDTGRWTDSEVDSDDHVRDKAKTEETLQLFLEMQNSSVVQKVLSFDAQLGYEIPTL